MMYVSQQLESAACQFLRELVRHRTEDDEKTNAVLKDEYGDVRKVVGGMFRANGGRGVRLSMLGLTAHDVAEFRKELKAKTGVTLSQESADQLLSEAAYSGKLDNVKSVDEKRAYERDKKARRRRWARENGYCIVCTKNAASFRDDGSQCSTCRDCQTKANEAKARKRQSA